MFELEAIANEIKKDMTDGLKRSGFFFSIFSRVKKESSVVEKLKRKDYVEGKQIQDFIGLRIALYFPDDIDPVIDFLRDKFDLDNKDIDLFAEDTFRPKRLNLVFRVRDDHMDLFEQSVNRFYDGKIDTTFEVQIRTLLSEGWHEVEHDLRYKCKDEWEDQKDLSRTLNGIYATLETSEWSMLTLFNELAYRNYKNRSWSAMIRNKFRIRFANTPLSEKISNFFNQNIDIAKEIYKLDRLKFLKKLNRSNVMIPITFDNIVYILNYLYFKNRYLDKIQPPFIKEEIESGFADKRG